jgi:hypothetical protein
MRHSLSSSQNSALKSSNGSEITVQFDLIKTETSNLDYNVCLDIGYKFDGVAKIIKISRG